MIGTMNEKGNFILEFQNDELLFFSKVMTDYAETMEQIGWEQVDPVRLHRYRLLTNVFLQEAQRANRAYAQDLKKLRDLPNLVQESKDNDK